METPPPAPSRAEVEAWFVALLDGRRSRDEADRWAAQWMVSDEDTADHVVSWALEILCGIDLRHGPQHPFLHDDQQLHDWLMEFRTRCGGIQ